MIAGQEQVAAGRQKEHRIGKGCAYGAQNCSLPDSSSAGAAGEPGLILFALQEGKGTVFALVSAAGTDRDRVPDMQGLPKPCTSPRAGTPGLGAKRGQGWHHALGAVAGSLGAS